MRLLDRYIGVSVISSILIVTSVLLALFTFMGFFEELDDIGQGQYDARQAILYVLLSIPSLMYQLMPMATLLGCIIGLGMLANNSELIVIRSAGVSLTRIAWSVIKVGLLVVAVLIVIGEWVAPRSLEIAQNLRANAKSNNLRIGSEEGMWAKDGLTMINAKQLLPGDRLGQLSIYRLDEQYRVVELLEAEYAAYQGGQWTLHNVTSSTVVKEPMSVGDSGNNGSSNNSNGNHTDGNSANDNNVNDNNVNDNNVNDNNADNKSIDNDSALNSALSGKIVTTEQHKVMAWDTTISPDLIDLVSVKPETLSVWGLYQYTQYLRKNGLSVGRFEQTLWSKFTTPVITMLMVLLAIPLVFGSMRTVSISQRVFVGVLIGVGFNILNRLANYAGLVYEMNTALYMVSPIAVAALFTYFMYKRVY
jgi:lipopolysaccharide export system permease protein